jgi:prephenate dehydratase
MKQEILLGVSGERGSFSEQAGLLYSQKNHLQTKLVFLLDMEGVLDALESEKIHLGIFPVVNTIGGLVVMAFEAMGKHRFAWVDQLAMPINQCLLTKWDVEAADIRQIVSHPQGLAQCQKYLSHHFHNAKQIAWQDTAKAAKDLAENHLESVSAVIAPKRAAEIYHLKILAENIQDNATNITTFIIVKSG